MEPAEKKMREVLEQIPFKNASRPVLQNFTALPHSNAKELKENLIRQVSAPVLWMQSMQNWLRAHSERPVPAIECGSGTVLRGLLKKIDSEAFQVLNTQTLEELKQLEKIYV
jgi:[acyl-carrier-protein] S-malonyltransferase